MTLVSWAPALPLVNAAELKSVTSRLTCRVCVLRGG